MKTLPGLLHPSGRSNKNHFPHNHLQSLLDGFVDFSDHENYKLLFKGLSVNSKKVHEGYLFFACAGVGNNLHHGIAYAGEAINCGATCIVWEPTTELHEIPLSCRAEVAGKKFEIPVISLPELHEKLGVIAARYYQQPSHELNVIGITGTNGKTTTAHFIAQLLTIMDHSPCAVLGTLGNGLYGQLVESTHTTPDALTLQSLIAQYKQQGAQSLVMEVSSHGLAQGRVNGIEFNTAVFTNLTRDHLDYHGDMQGYAEEKLKLFKISSLQQVIINQDDELSQRIVDIVNKQQQIAIKSYSRQDSSADYYASNIVLNSQGMCFNLRVEANNYVVKSHLLGDFNVDNLLAAIATLHSQGYPLADLCAAVACLDNVSGRMEKVTLPENSLAPALLVVDYAHTPDALEKVLNALKQHAQKNLYCVFGCGGDRDKGKRPLMAKIAEQFADKIIVTSDNPRTESAEQIIADIMSGFVQPENVLIEVDRAKAIHQTLSLLTANDVLLIAGKGHEHYQEINGQRLAFSDQQTIQNFYMNQYKAGAKH